MFRIHIETDNAAFDPDAAPEVARILRELADRLTDHADMNDHVVRLPLRDVNGNGIGFAIYHPDEGPI